MDKRTRARELAMQGLYQLDVQGDEALPHLNLLFEDEEKDELVLSLASKWSREAWSHHERCDELIVKSTAKWGLSRLCEVDKCILRLAVYQLLQCSDIPPKVVINEAIELAKKFSTEKSPGFVNGVLDSVMKKIQKQNNR